MTVSHSRRVDMSRRPFAERRFVACLAVIVAVGAFIRVFRVFADRRWLIGGDGFVYHFAALRLADGLGYTSPAGDVGAPLAHHPPGWITVLGAVSWLGGRTLHAHEYVGAVCGIGVVVLAGLVGRRYFNPRVGLVAALLTAVYPGFWILEGNVLSEPLALFMLGLFLLVVPGLRDRPTLVRSALAGALCGLVALVRSEEIFLLVLVLAPVLLLARELSLRRRALALFVAFAACFAMIAPWAVYNSTRFEEPVLLSTNDGNLVLLGNCPPVTYSGELLGWYTTDCLFRLGRAHPGFDRSQLNSLARTTGLRNELRNVDRLPIVVPARFGRLLALFNPGQTVKFVSRWMTTSTKPIWGWVASFWVLLLLAGFGTVIARRRRAFLLPLLAPVVIVVVNVAISYGEPRYHTMSDLGIIVLAAVAVDRVAHRARPPTLAATDRDDELVPV